MRCAKNLLASYSLSLPARLRSSVITPPAASYAWAGWIRVRGLFFLRPPFHHALSDRNRPSYAPNTARFDRHGLF